MSQILLQTHNLTKKYGEQLALNGVSLTLRQGDIYGLVGRNGAGKTTFFKCVMGLARPTSGEVVLGGVEPGGRAASGGGKQRDIEGSGSISEPSGGAASGSGEKPNLNIARRRMGFMINPSFFPYLDPYENLRYLSRVKGVRSRGEVERLLKLVGLDGVRKPFKSFSLGMKHRLGIAGALLGAPCVVVLDEPVNGLDPQGIIDMRTVIKDVHSQTGATFIISSHILSELDLVATRFGFIEQGVLLKEISHSDLHGHTKKSLLIDVDDAEKARAALRAIGVTEVTVVMEAATGMPADMSANASADASAGVSGDMSADVSAGATANAATNMQPNYARLILDSHLDKSNEIARALVNGGVELYGLHRRETTLEEYFVRLVGGLDGNKE